MKFTAWRTHTSWQGKCLADSPPFQHRLQNNVFTRIARLTLVPKWSLLSELSFGQAMSVKSLEVFYKIPEQCLLSEKVSNEKWI